jgi:hypothetical protein
MSLPHLKEERRGMYMPGSRTPTRNQFASRAACSPMRSSFLAVLWLVAVCALLGSSQTIRTVNNSIVLQIGDGMCCVCVCVCV